MKDIIAFKALELFDKQGFHGTSMRDVSLAAGCTVPAIYYHYKDKETLFEEIVCVKFQRLVELLDGRVPKDISSKEAFIYRIQKKKQLTKDQKRIYRLAIKTLLGMEGCEKARQRLEPWVQEYFRVIQTRLEREIPSPQWVQFVMRCVFGLTQHIILWNDAMPNSDIREEVERVFKVAQQNAPP